MKFYQRLAFYLFGALIGCIIVFFIWEKKGTDFCYLPNCRILKDIRVKKRNYTPEVQQLIHNKKLDTAAITYTYYNGAVDLSKSNTKLKSCKKYLIESRYLEKNYTFFVENCDSIATIEKVVVTP